jgi:hypothetical protein
MTTLPTHIGTCRTGCNCTFCLTEASQAASTPAEPITVTIPPGFEPDFDEFPPKSEEI